MKPASLWAALPNQPYWLRAARAYLHDPTTAEQLLAGRLRLEIVGQAPVPAEPYSSLLIHALGAVDWHALARVIIGEARE